MKFKRLDYLYRNWRSRMRGDKFGIRFVREHDLRGATVLDVGANRGIYCYWLRKQVGTDGRVFAFEPQPELAGYLNDAVRTFRWTNVEIVNAGLSNVDGSQVLYRPRHHWGGASLESAASTDVDELTVKLIRLDTYAPVENARPVRFIKCDVEGHEHAVFDGGRRIIMQDRPDVLLEEGDPGNPQCRSFAILKDMDYEGFCFFGSGYVPLSRYGDIKGRMHPKATLNFAFVPRERAATMGV